MSADTSAALAKPPLPEGDFVMVSASAHAAGESSVSAAIGSTAAWDRFQSEAELEAWLIEAATAQYGHLFGEPSYIPHWQFFGRPITFDTAGVVVRNGIGTSFNLLGMDYSSTSIQVEGVDEADIVETDGEYLYVISGRDLVIVQAGVGDDLKVASRVRLQQRPVGMYLSGDRLTLVSTTEPPSEFSIMPFLSLWSDADESLHSGANQRATTTVTVLDLADRAAPTLVQKTQLDGRLVASRVVDGQLRLVLSNEIRLPPPMLKSTGEVNVEIAPWHTWLRPVAGIGLVVDAQFGLTDVAASVEPVFRSVHLLDTWQPEVYETQEEYIARVRDELLASLQFQMRSIAVDGSVISEAPLFEATDLLKPESLRDRYITTVATFDLAGDSAGPAAKVSLITGSVPNVYSTADSLYLFAEKSRPNWSEIMTNDDLVAKTAVWKFGFEAETHAVDLVAKGSFHGALLNQFAADEHDGYLRVVTMPNGWFFSGHSLHVIEQVGRELRVVSSLTGIAPDENLYSVRFMGERAFFVTFRIVDPFYAVDLADPLSPKLLGELRIPGYSDYLQPIDENHLLAIGRTADETTGMFESLQVSLFDISNMAEPQLLHSYSFGGGRTTATIATGDRWIRGDGDHHAVSYFASDQILALPVYSADEVGWWNSDAEQPIFSPGQGGLQVFRIDVAAGFSPLAMIEHEAPIQRTVRIGARLYAVSTGAVSAHQLDDPSLQLGRVDIGDGAGDPLVELSPHQSPVEQFAITMLDEEATVHEESSSALLGIWPQAHRRQERITPRPSGFPQMPPASRSDSARLLLIAMELAENRTSSDTEKVIAAMSDAALEDDLSAGKSSEENFGQARLTSFPKIRLTAGSR